MLGGRVNHGHLPTPLLDEHMLMVTIGMLAMCMLNFYPLFFDLDDDIVKLVDMMATD